MWQAIATVDEFIVSWLFYEALPALLTPISVVYHIESVSGTVFSCYGTQMRLNGYGSLYHLFSLLFVGVGSLKTLDLIVAHRSILLGIGLVSGCRSMARLR